MRDRKVVEHTDVEQLDAAIHAHAHTRTLSQTSVPEYWSGEGCLLTRWLMPLLSSSDSLSLSSPPSLSLSLCRSFLNRTISNNEHWSRCPVHFSQRPSTHKQTHTDTQTRGTHEIMETSHGRRPKSLVNSWCSCLVTKSRCSKKCKWNIFWGSDNIIIYSIAITIVKPNYSLHFRPKILNFSICTINIHHRI